MDELLKTFFTNVLDDDLVLKIVEMREEGISDIEILSKLLQEYEVNEDD